MKEFLEESKGCRGICGPLGVTPTVRQDSASMFTTLLFNNGVNLMYDALASILLLLLFLSDAALMNPVVC